jgi:hypothetical protein
MKNKSDNWDFAVFFIVGIMIFVLGLFIIYNPSNIDAWLGYIPVGVGFCFILCGIGLFIKGKTKILKDSKSKNNAN